MHRVGSHARVAATLLPGPGELNTRPLCPYAHVGPRGYSAQVGPGSIMEPDGSRSVLSSYHAWQRASARYRGQPGQDEW